MSALGDAFAGIVSDGSLLLAAAVAALAGLISFASPCVLPLVPGYLAYVAGLTGAQSGGASDSPAPEDEPRGARSGATATAARRHITERRRVVLGALLFILGFTVVFVSFGALFGGLGRLLLEWAPVLTRVMGVVTILMGLAFLGGVPWLQRERRITRRPPAGLAGAPVLGVVFGLGWTPCLGPTLSAVNTLAYTEASAGRGAALGLAYCIGLGVPFLLVALGARRTLSLSALARRHAPTVMRIGGVLLLVLGLLLVTGLWDGIMLWLRSWLAATGLGTSSI
ncbi:cytochrome c biogenesis protein CcdA [Modestobacter marinus]|uniref:Cytochrome C biogenesis protein CcdA n=1 Tax=Modestobacter marinus TaxID=477641 RepID=A0A846LPF7_9ACTN|nr:cytochrome c biogenesis protein CcdA [Modestobacter marinus]NIH69297.1 cytochrome c-type biogenesis protein [Modestobacter marinus]GGL83248.1 cytochrome C biogenesis protein CcdA [Modestobacter marinus]